MEQLQLPQDSVMNGSEMQQREAEPTTALNVDIEVRGLTGEAADRFTNAALLMAKMFAQFAQSFEVCLPQLLLIGTLDFQATVHNLLKEIHGPDTPDYTVERLGGTAVAKNVWMNDDHSKVAIVISAHLWIENDNRAQAIGIFFLAHELTHAVLDRLRIESGALEGVTFPSKTPRSVARSITRTAVDEMRCDIVADVVLSLSASKMAEGTAVQLHYSDPELSGPSTYRDRLAELLVARVHPGWRDLVNRYRNWDITLEALRQTLFEETDQVMTCVGHAEAEARSTPENTDLFLPPATGTPGMTWLVGPVWNTVMTAVAQQPLIPQLSNFKTAELEILDIGERELLAMWGRLGVTFGEPRPDGSYRIYVNEPKEPPAS